jgi:hypothetical protein
VNSPSYRTRVVPDLRLRMRAWNLSRAERIALWTRLLTELPSNPDRLLLTAIRRPNVWAHRFSLGSSPQRRFFLCHGTPRLHGRVARRRWHPRFRGRPFSASVIPFVLEGKKEGPGAKP